MAKKTKETKTSAKKEVKPLGPAERDKAANLVRLLNILALLLAIAAFLLQLFAVLSHHWKWQKTNLHSIISPTYHYAQANVHDDSQLNQNYGLFSRQVKLFANHDEQLDLLASTRFPRYDNDDDDALHSCLSRTSTVRGALLTCSKHIDSPEQCHCRRYPYWKAVITFEILGLIFLGLVVFVAALLATHLHTILKLAGAGLAFLAFICLLIGLILILSHLKRETKSFADIYPHIYSRLTHKIGTPHDPHRVAQRNPTVLREAVRRRTVRQDDNRQAYDTYRLYPLAANQQPYNQTHYAEYSYETREYSYKPYILTGQHGSYVPPASYVPPSQRVRVTYPTTTKYTTLTATLHNRYGPVLGYDGVFQHTRAGIGCSTVLSIIAMILALLVPLILVFSWLTFKKIDPTVKTKEYVPVPQDVPAETLVVQQPTRIIHTDYDSRRPIADAIVTTRHPPLQQPTVETSSPTRTIYTDYDSRRPVADAVVTTRNVPPQGPYDSYGPRTEPVIVRDVIIREDHPTYHPPQEHSFPVQIETTQTTRGRK